MSTRIAIATCDSHAGFCVDDDAPFIEAFVEQGAEARSICWDDADTDWSVFDAVIIRTTWDYMDRLDEYLAWVDHVDRVSRIINPPEIVRQNLDKVYLRNLENVGIPIVPTRWVEPGDANEVEQILSDTGWPELIIKPTVGAGASGLGRFSVHQLEDAAIHTREQLSRGTVIVQPMLETIRTRGELSIVLLNGEVSHAVRKVPATGDIRVQIEFGGQYSLVDPTEREIDIARRAHDMIAGEHAPLLYARADLVEPTLGKPAIIEFEAVEPELFFPMAPGAARCMAKLTLERLALARA